MEVCDAEAYQLFRATKRDFVHDFRSFRPFIFAKPVRHGFPILASHGVGMCFREGSDLRNAARDSVLVAVPLFGAVLEPLSSIGERGSVREIRALRFREKTGIRQ